MAGFAAAASATAGKAAAAKSAGVAAVAPAVNGLFGAITMRRQYKNQKKLMAQQNQYDIEAFNRENARQDWLMLNEDSLKRQSLENAGYSTADPNGTGVTTPAVGNMDTPGTPTAPLLSGSPGTDFVSAFNAMRQAELIDSVKRKNEAEAKKAEEEGKGIAIQNEYIRPRSEAEVKQILQDIELKKKQGKLTEVQADTAERLCKATENKTEAECKQIDQAIENAKEELRRIREQINLIKAQEKTEVAQQSYFQQAAAYQKEQAGLTRKQSFGQDWLNKGYKFNAALSYLNTQEKDIIVGLRSDLSSMGVDLDEHNITSLIAKGVLTDIARGNKASYSGPPGTAGTGVEHLFKRKGILDLRFE